LDNGGYDFITMETDDNWHGVIDEVWLKWDGADGTLKGSYDVSVTAHV